MTKQLDFDTIEAKLIARGKDSVIVSDRIIPTLQKIDRIRHEKDALILAHYYQLPEIQLIADFVGDSYALAKTAKGLQGSNLVVSCTVEFMAEMIKLLCPDKKVIIPSTEASCSIAEGMNPETIRRIRSFFPDAAIVGYINSRAATMASYDAACTSTNAREVVSKIRGDPIIMVPDYYLAVNTFNELPNDRNYLAYKGIVNDTIVLHQPHTDALIELPLGTTTGPERDTGTCIVHEEFTPDDVDYFRHREHVDIVIAHPEVKPEVAAKADFVGSTNQMIQYVGQTKARRIMVVSECDLVSPLLEKYEDRDFVTPCKICKYMKRNTVDGLLYAIEHEVYVVNVPDDVSKGAKAAIDRMFELCSQ
jgi:quinolinate synthase